MRAREEGDRERGNKEEKGTKLTININGFLVLQNQNLALIILRGQVVTDFPLFLVS